MNHPNEYPLWTRFSRLCNAEVKRSQPWPSRWQWNWYAQWIVLNRFIDTPRSAKGFWFRSEPRWHPTLLEHSFIKFGKWTQGPKNLQLTQTIWVCLMCFPLTFAGWQMSGSGENPSFDHGSIPGRHCFGTSRDPRTSSSSCLGPQSSRGKKSEAESREALVLALTAIHDDSVVSQLCDVGSVGCLVDLSWTNLGWSSSGLGFYHVEVDGKGCEKQGWRSRHGRQWRTAPVKIADSSCTRYFSWEFKYAVSLGMKLWEAFDSSPSIVWWHPLSSFVMENQRIYFFH